MQRCNMIRQFIFVFLLLWSYQSFAEGAKFKRDIEDSLTPEHHRHHDDVVTSFREFKEPVPFPKDDDRNKPVFTTPHKRPYHPLERGPYTNRSHTLENLANHFKRKVEFVKRLPYQILRGSVGPDYRKFGSCQYRPCLSVRHAIDTFLTKGFLGK